MFIPNNTKSSPSAPPPSGPASKKIPYSPPTGTIESPSVVNVAILSGHNAIESVDVAVPASHSANTTSSIQNSTVGC